VCFGALSLASGTHVNDPDSIQYISVSLAGRLMADSGSSSDDFLDYVISNRAPCQEPGRSVDPASEIRATKLNCKGIVDANATRQLRDVYRKGKRDSEVLYASRNACRVHGELPTSMGHLEVAFSW
jgi:hypothetical protein